ncbi:MAG: MATE family efflux transporter [Lachnospiraceae bacterium]|nr:MATE family efflux transporter [Lachnospiraceae bacterium]
MKTRKKPDLLQDPIRGLFFKYLVPSVSATLVTSIYVLADTIIVGKGLGANAVAALNLILPLFTIFFGTGLLFGVGGSVMMAVSKGAGDHKKTKEFFTTALFASIAMILIYDGLGIMYFDEVLTLLGGTDATMGLLREYAKVFMIGTPFFVFSTFLQAFIRNDNAPKLAMTAVITGGILNIILDLIFVFPMRMGMAGAAFATVLGSVITCTILCSHFFCKQNTLKVDLHGFSFRSLGRIFQNGLSSFLIEMANGIVTFVFNRQILIYLADIGVTVYSIIANTAIIVMSLGNGISQAAQPLITMNYGAEKMDRVKEVKRIALVSAAILGGLFVLLGLLLPETVVRVFIHPTDEIMALAPAAIRIYFVSFIGCALNMFLSNYYQAIVKPIPALTICLLRGLILSVILMMILPAVFGASGIWFVMPVTEAVTLGVAVLIGKKSNC